MSELREQQTVALERLCAQFEKEQRRHAERVEQQAAQIEALQQRVEQLGGQVTYLAKDYRTLAETLREFWR